MGCKGSKSAASHPEQQPASATLLKEPENAEKPKEAAATAPAATEVTATPATNEVSEGQDNASTEKATEGAALVQDPALPKVAAEKTETEGQGPSTEAAVQDNPPAEKTAVDTAIAQDPTLPMESAEETITAAETEGQGSLADMAAQDDPSTEKGTVDAALVKDPALSKEVVDEAAIAAEMPVASNQGGCTHFCCRTEKTTEMVVP